MSSEEWLAVLRIGLGAWWIESFRHKNKRAWFKEGSGIGWARSVAEKHRWPVVKRSFDAVVAPRPTLIAYLVVLGELAVGLGLLFGLLTPVAAAASILFSVLYFFLMIHDWAEQGQNLMMLLIAVVVIGAQAWQRWSIDDALGWF